MAGARPDTWMPIYWGDYLKDTGHLTTAEHGAYLLLIAHYWSTGQSIPNNDPQLARITRQSPKSFRQMRLTLSRFFIVSDSKWEHVRIEKELTAAHDFIEKQRLNGSKGGRPSNPSLYSGLTQTEPKANPKITTSPSPSPSPHESDLSENLTDAAREASLTPRGYATRAKPPTTSERVKELAAAHRRKMLGTA